MLRFLVIALGIAFPIVAGLWTATGFARPWDVTEAEMGRRYWVIAGMVLGLSVAGAAIVVGLERLQQWIDRKRDPWRRLD